MFYKLFNNFQKIFNFGVRIHIHRDILLRNIFFNIPDVNKPRFYLYNNKKYLNYFKR
jgi:hypothetical protein